MRTCNWISAAAFCAAVALSSCSHAQTAANDDTRTPRTKPSCIETTTRFLQSQASAKWASFADERGADPVAAVPGVEAFVQQYANPTATCTDETGTHERLVELETMTAAYEWLAEMGSNYTFGKSIDQDHVRAGPLYEQACDGGVAWACHNLCIMYRRGQGVAADAARSKSLCVQACDGDHPQACKDLGYLAMIEMKTVADAQRAVGLLKKACDGGDYAGCGLLATIIQDGLGVPKNEAVAAALYKMACDGGDTKSCRDSEVDAGAESAEIAGAPQSDTHWAKLETTGCEQGDLAACRKLGKRYLSGEGVPQDEAKAAALLSRACDGGNGGGCSAFGVLYLIGAGVEKNANTGWALIEKACSLKDENACNLVAQRKKPTTQTP